MSLLIKNMRIRGLEAVTTAMEIFGRILIHLWWMDSLGEMIYMTYIEIPSCLVTVMPVTHREAEALLLLIAVTEGLDSPRFPVWAAMAEMKIWGMMVYPRDEEPACVSITIITV
jgi:hypothetical protein